MRRVALAVTCLASSAFAQDIDSGAALFQRHCATCHGADAKGQGPMAPILLVQPTDLTQLAATEAGTFPTKRVMSRIDGRDPLVSHGSNMPVFGPFFESGEELLMKLDNGEVWMTTQPVADLLAYLERLQE